jgi:hypothetical protein
MYFDGKRICPQNRKGSYAPIIVLADDGCNFPVINQVHRILRLPFFIGRSTFPHSQICLSLPHFWRTLAAMRSPGFDAMKALVVEFRANAETV